MTSIISIFSFLMISTDCWVLIDPTHLSQILWNLLLNAAEAIESEGLISIKTLPTKNRKIEIRVSDNGCGMNEEVLEHLFEPFYTRRRGGQGTGLGLAITYRIVADHGGHIEATSDGPGTGSRFRVTLPLVQHEKERQIKNQAA